MPKTEPEPWEYSLSIPNDLRAVTVSRRTLRLILTLHGLIGLVDVAELLAAELVSNAVRHTKGPAVLRVCWSSAGGVWVGGGGARPPPPPPPGGVGGARAGGGGGGVWGVGGPS